MMITQVMLVDHTHSIDPTLLQNVAVALNTQVTQHLTKYWSGINANVSYAPEVSALPITAWPVALVAKLPPGEGGYHLDKKNQPFARVIATPEDDSWTIDASHEIIEMLVDPYGNRLQSSQAIAIQGKDVVDAPGQFSYLVEACDPCEANGYAYEINGIAVSDFITPNFYDAAIRPATVYSYMGNVTHPRQLLPGGYISYVKEDGSWEQILWVDPAQAPTYNELGVGDAVRSLRESVHMAMGPKLDDEKHFQRRKAGGLPKAVQARVNEYAERRRASPRLAKDVLDRLKLVTADGT